MAFYVAYLKVAVPALSQNSLPLKMEPYASIPNTEEFAATDGHVDSKEDAQLSGLYHSISASIHEPASSDPDPGRIDDYLSRNGLSNDGALFSSNPVGDTRPGDMARQPEHADEPNRSRPISPSLPSGMDEDVDYNDDDDVDVDYNGDGGFDYNDWDPTEPSQNYAQIGSGPFSASNTPGKGSVSQMQMLSLGGESIPHLNWRLNRVTYDIRATKSK